MPEQDPNPTAATESAFGMGPVLPKERIQVIDILRGWAIFGILLVNMGAIYNIQTTWTGTGDVALTGADRAVELLIRFFGEGKFYTLFSFLFGLGFALQMGRAEARGGRFVPLYRRRLFALMLFGLANVTVFLWDAQLLIYAVLGFLLLLFRTCSPRTILVAAYICLLIPRVHIAVVEGVHELRLVDPQAAQQATREAGHRAAESRAETDQAHRVQSRGSYRELVALHAQWFVRWHFSFAYFPWHIPYLRWWIGGAFPLLLLGFYAGRRRIFENIPAHLSFIRKVMWWGLGLGLVGNLMWVVTSEMSNPAWPYLTRHVGQLFQAVGQPALCFFYASAIILLAQQEAWKTRLAVLAPVGRIALSNYLFQILVFAMTFYSYGLGLYGKVGPAMGLALTLLIFAVQILLSVWWV
ncbi:MAG: DUF418 domain-containing protein, partial [Terriglobales bacterium]